MASELKSRTTFEFTPNADGSLITLRRYDITDRVGPSGRVVEHFVSDKLTNLATLTLSEFGALLRDGLLTMEVLAEKHDLARLV